MNCHFCKQQIRSDEKALIITPVTISMADEVRHVGGKQLAAHFFCLCPTIEKLDIADFVERTDILGALLC